MSSSLQPWPVEGKGKFLRDAKVRVEADKHNHNSAHERVAIVPPRIVTISAAICALTPDQGRSLNVIWRLAQRAAGSPILRGRHLRQ
jgi:hypothetical protein